jgi:hypothetical protein
MKAKAKRYIPICCVCENVRDDARSPGAEPEWGPLNEYLRANRLSSGDYHLTHTYCPACAWQFTKLHRPQDAETLAGIAVPDGAAASRQPEFAGGTTVL